MTKEEYEHGLDLDEQKFELLWDMLRQASDSDLLAWLQKQDKLSAKFGDDIPALRDSLDNLLTACCEQYFDA